MEHLAHMGLMRNTYRILKKGAEGKRPHSPYRHRWEGNIKVGLKEVSVRVWSGLNLFRIGRSEEFLRTCNKLSGSLKVEESLAS